MTAADPKWREDPRWQLAEHVADFWAGEEPPARPPADAELAQPEAWCSIIRSWNGKLTAVATWYRPLV